MRRWSQLTLTGRGCGNGSPCLQWAANVPAGAIDSTSVTCLFADSALAWLKSRSLQQRVTRGCVSFQLSHQLVECVPHVDLVGRRSVDDVTGRVGQRLEALHRNDYRLLTNLVELGFSLTPNTFARSSR